jgi:chromate transporter
MTSDTSTHNEAAIGFRQALWFWFKLGFISFGGPAGQIGIMHQALVVERRWISDKRFLHALNYCMLLPGPEAQQLATYLGWLMHKTIGGVLAGALFVLPSLLLLIGLSWVYVSFGDMPLLAALFFGIKPAVIAVVLQAVHRIGSRTLRNRYMWALAALSFIAIFAAQLPFPLIVLGAAICGALLGKFVPHSVQTGSAHASGAATEQRPAIIDDHTPTPSHARFKLSRLLLVLGAGVVLWVLPMWMLWQAFGEDNSLLRMGWFFSKAALMTFGGAYAVLPYVYQGAVETFQWLTPQQMIDGLALGESTPGPLIMVVSFVGYLGAYAQPVLSGLSASGSAVLGAVVATWFTFLPSFIFILGGGPLVEHTQNQLRFTAPLTAITAAVVGVMLNLALFFAYHVLWPQGLTGRFEWLSALLTVACAFALLRLKWSVLRVLAVSAVVGLLFYFVA